MKGILETRNLFNTDKGFFGVVLTIVLLPIILVILLIKYGFDKIVLKHKDTSLEASKSKQIKEKND